MQEEIKNLQEILMISYESLDKKVLSFMAQYLDYKAHPINSYEKRYREVPHIETKSVLKEYHSNYLSFLNKTRGDENSIKKKYKMYLPYINKNWQVLDIGCGRGEFLQLLSGNGINAYGIDINQEMINRCKEKNLDVKQEEAIDHLTKIPEASLGTIMCSHILEHIPFNLWFDFLELCKKALINNGSLIVETLNPRSIYGMFEWFWKDPTHINPVYPEYLTHLLELIGFKKISLNYYEDIPSNIILLKDKIEDKIHQDNIKKINDFLFKPIEYYIIAYK